MIDFNKLIDNHLSREISFKRIGRYYPSEIGGCLRKTWYSYKDPKPTDTSLVRIFEAGNILHEFIEEVIRSEKNPEIELLQTEMPIKLKTDEFLISGRIDDLILIKLENKEVLVEVKSCKFLPKELKKEHESQIQLYMEATGVHEGILLYVQKDDLQTASFEIKYDKSRIKEILERFNALHASLVEDKMPQAEAKNNVDMQWLCDKCSWKKECWELEKSKDN
jgi:CRISPR/Cas system-associated exonuclease Cas4 (RecB family)